MTDICDLGVINLPNCDCPAGPAGPAGSSGGSILVNDYSLSAIATKNILQDYTAVKEYTIPATLLAVGDRLKVEIHGYMVQDTRTNMDMLGGIVVDNHGVGLCYLPTGVKQVFYEIVSIIDIVAATGADKNIVTHSTIKYSFLDPSVNIVPVEVTIFDTLLTVDYDSGAKKITTMGEVKGANPSAINYNKLTQFTVEHFKLV